MSPSGFSEMIMLKLFGMMLDKLECPQPLLVIDSIDNSIELFLVNSGALPILLKPIFSNEVRLQRKKPIHIAKAIFCNK
jgi:hypothetical protein